jgi:tRNA 2-thiouridine synthesizing protein A
MSENLHSLDARGLNCPLRILRTKKAMAGLQVGEILEITATDPGSAKDLDAWLREHGHQGGAQEHEQERRRPHR